MLKKVWWIVVLVTHSDYWERKSTLINFFWIYICSTYNLVLRNPLRQNKYSFLSVFYGYIFLSLDIESILKKKTCIIVFWCNIQVQVQNESPKSRHHSLSFVFKCTLQNAFIGFEKGFCSSPTLLCSHVAAAAAAAESCWGMMLKTVEKMARILKVSLVGLVCTLSDFTRNIVIFAQLFVTKLTSHFWSFSV